MSDPPGKSTRKRSQREQRQAVRRLLQRKMQQEGYPSKTLERACSAWDTFVETVKPQIRSVPAYAAAMEYVIALRFGHAHITQRSLAKRYEVSQASIARIHPKILNCLSPSPPSSTKDESPVSFFASMSRAHQKEEIDRLLRLPQQDEVWCGVLLDGDFVRLLAEAAQERFLREAPLRLFSSLSVRMPRPSDPISVVTLAWIGQTSGRILGWFPVVSSELSKVWLPSLRITMQKPLFGAPHRPKKVQLPVSVSFDDLGGLLGPLSCEMAPLEHKDFAQLDALVARELSAAPYNMLEQEGAWDDDLIGGFFERAAQVALALEELEGSEARSWGRFDAALAMHHGWPQWPCREETMKAGLIDAWAFCERWLVSPSSPLTAPLSGPGAAWWFGWKRPQETLLCWSAEASVLGTYLAASLDKQGLMLSQEARSGRLVEQLLRTEEPPPGARRNNSRVVWELRFWRAASLPHDLRMRLFSSDLTIAHARAIPVLSIHNVGGSRLPVSASMLFQVNAFLEGWLALRDATRGLSQERFPDNVSSGKSVFSVLSLQKYSP